MSSVEIGIARNKEGKVEKFYIDLQKYLNVVVGGSTGSGKSVLLSEMILSSDLPTVLIDCKFGVEFGCFTFMNKVVNNKCYSTPEEVNRIFTILEADMEKRYKTLLDNNAKNYTELPDGVMQEVLIVIDEVQEVIKNRKNKPLLEKLVKLGRACGYHFIIATQTPSKKVLGDIKAQCRAFISLKVNRPEESRLILDDPIATTIDKVGGMYVKLDNNEPFPCLGLKYDLDNCNFKYLNF